MEALMPEDNQLGTSVTYLDPNDRRKPVRIQGVYFEPNQTTDLTEFLPQKQAEQLAKKLSVNHFFQVEGGPNHQEQLREQEQRRFEQEQRIQDTYFRQQKRRLPLDEDQGQELPPNYNAPENATLEGQNAPRTDPDDVVPTRTRNKRS